MRGYSFSGDEEDLVQLIDADQDESVHVSRKSFWLAPKVMMVLFGVVLVVAASIIGTPMFRCSKGSSSKLCLFNKDNEVEQSISFSSSDSVLNELASSMRSAMDNSVNPCDDFYQYACGNWLKATEIPSTKSSYTRSFSGIDDENKVVLREIVKKDWPVIGTLYDACMDTTTLDKVGIHDFAQQFYIMISNAQEESEVLSNLRQFGINAFFESGIGVDFHDPSTNLIQLGQGGLTLVKDNYSNKKILKEFESFASKMIEFFENGINLNLRPYTSYDDRAARVVALESKLADISLAPDALRDPVASYNKFTIEDFSKLTDFDFEQYFIRLAKVFELKDVSSSTEIVVDNPIFFKQLLTVLTTLDKADLLDYYIVHVMRSFASLLTTPIAQEHFKFFGQVLNGIREAAPREEKCIDTLDGYLGDILGRYYVESHFPGESKNISLEMISLIKQAFLENLPSVPWMDESTRIEAKKKLSLIEDNIGYPDKWTDYSSIWVESSKFIADILKLTSFSIKNEWQTLNRPVDRFHWQMTVSTVNAYYDPTLNTINFPAGIIQPIFFKKDYPAAVNFGGIGMVAGHELAHGFDDQGRQFDGTGKLRDWWPSEIVNKFTEKAQCLVDQYSQFKVGDLNVNGKLTLGENIADNSGIKTAYYAFKLWQKSHGVEESILPELSNEQLFFLSFGQSWCSKITPEYQKELIQRDPHSPAHLRVKVPLMNLDEFASAFSCPVGSNMNPREKCHLW